MLIDVYKSVYINKSLNGRNFEKGARVRKWT